MHVTNQHYCLIYIFSECNLRQTIHSKIIHPLSQPTLALISPITRRLTHFQLVFPPNLLACSKKSLSGYIAYNNG